jgi:hypothetical protein
VSGDARGDDPRLKGATEGLPNIESRRLAAGPGILCRGNGDGNRERALKPLTSSLSMLSLGFESIPKVVLRRLVS